MLGVGNLGDSLLLTDNSSLPVAIVFTTAASKCLPTSLVSSNCNDDEDNDKDSINMSFDDAVVTTAAESSEDDIDQPTLFMGSKSDDSADDTVASTFCWKILSRWILTASHGKGGGGGDNNNDNDARGHYQWHSAKRPSTWP